jgi:ectoine hydroxylase-related dioxygenase (phytanoyl-CoA dioxygenase family)
MPSKETSSWSRSPCLVTPCCVLRRCGKTTAMVSSRRRLGQLGRHIAGSSGTADTENPPALDVLALDVQRRKAEAVADERFDEAQELKDTLAVLDGSVHASIPAGQLGPGADTTLDEKVEFFQRCGYCPVQALEGEQLLRTQAAFREHSARVKREWMAAKEEGEGVEGLGYASGGNGFARSYFDIPHFIEQDPSFLDLLDNPRTTEVLRRVIGEGSGSYIYGGADTIQVAHVQARTVPPEQEGGYISWHRDIGGRPWRHKELCQHVKVMIYFSDVAEDGGCTVVVPGSHRVLEGPQLLGRSFGGGGNRGTGAGGGAAPQSEMPYHKKFAVPAGTAVLMDTRIWHTAFSNTSGVDRWGVILTYTPRTHRQLGMVVDNARSVPTATRQLYCAAAS